MTFVSYAQNFEDVLLFRALGDVTPGFYIDVGASEPDTDSVTRAFYDRGWRGINVEPTEAAYQRLAAWRPRDVNLRLAAGAAPGTATFFSVEDAHSGLSSLDPAAAARYGAEGLAVQEVVVETRTLAAICREHAPAVVHFLKIDVEGAERAVLEGADFTKCRPWIVLLEATEPNSTIPAHEGWEGLLLDAGYRFVWFDGLNRFYAAAERYDRLARHFQTPLNYFDDFICAGDLERAKLLLQQGARADLVASQLARADSRAAIGEDRAEAAYLRLAESAAEVSRLRAQSAAQAQEAGWLREMATAAEHRATVAEHRATAAQGWLDAMHRSTSWRVTQPLRRLAALRGGGGTEDAPPGDAPPAPLPVPEAAPPLPVPAAALPIRAVHQFHSGCAAGDAITNAMLLVRGVLRGLGYDSRIFVQHHDPGCGDGFHSIEDLPEHGRYVLIVRHSMGHDALQRILALPVARVLIYHNITPPGLLAEGSHAQTYARLGREQLALLRPAVAAALVDSEYNALELRQAGFADVTAAPLLFDVDRLLEAAPAPSRGGTFTILFVGRIAESKGQRELVAAYARFRSVYRAESRLVLVGRHGGGDDAYLVELLALIRRHKLDVGAVELTGLVSDAELARRYSEADLFVSASQHEGFGVPLVEAMAHGVPVLAWPAGAVPYTLDGMGELLDDTTPAGVAAHMLDLAEDPARRLALVQRQRAALDRFRLERQVPALLDALAQAGVARPAGQAVRDALAANMRFTIAGHVNGSYSLAEINRSVALAIAAARPGAVRLLPVEGDVTAEVRGIPEAQHAALSPLLARSMPPTAPHAVISQHYPVWVPHERGDLTLALFFWEESLVPPSTVAVLNAGFGGVLAPTRPVAKALLDSGVTAPVRVVGHAPDLRRFRDVRRVPGGPFTFLHVSSLFPRKGADVLLRAYASAFRRGDPVRLVIKGFPNPHNTVAEQLAAMQAADPDLPGIELIDRDLSADALLALYAGADVVVLPSRGEGYNLPAAEALAAGIPVIVTGWGGHMDFVADAPGVRLLQYRLAPSGSHLATPFSLWAEPDEADLIAALREAVDAGPRRLPPLAVPDGFTDRFSRAAADLLLAPAPPPLTVAWITTWDVRCGIAEYARHLLAALPGPATVFADLRTAACSTERVRVHPLWGAGDAESLPPLLSAILRHDPGALVIQHQPGLFTWPTLAALLAAAAVRRRVVCVTLHNTADLLEHPLAVRGPALAALASISRVVVHTLQDVNRLAALGLVENVTLIPHGAPPPEPAVPARVLDPGADVLLGCYGFFLPGKGIPQLIEALGHVRQHWPGARLRLVNAEYPLEPSATEIAACRDLVERAGLADAVEFETGFLDHADSTALLRGCDLVVLPYQHSKEASSAALRSALAAGVPVAATRMPLFEEAGDAVAWLPGTDPRAIADGIRQVLLDPAGRDAAVQSAERWLADRDWAAVARRWQGMLDALWASGLVAP